MREQWIPPGVVPILVKAIEDEVAGSRNGAMERGAWGETELGIFENFALPVLREHADTGLASTRLLNKAWAMTVLTIPPLLAVKAQDFSEEQMGALAKLYIEYALDMALIYSMEIPDAQYVRNFGSVTGLIETALALRPPQKR